jgi:acetaldehyde dehydrogenase/alcohol dehydrogenase
VDEQVFIAELDLLAMGAYRDQCAPANPRMPMLADMKVLMTGAYYGIGYPQAKARLELSSRRR